MNGFGSKNDTKYATFRNGDLTLEPVTKLGYGIKVSKLKEICALETPRASINDMLVVIIIKAVALYLEQEKDELFLSHLLKMKNNKESNKSKELESESQMSIVVPYSYRPKNESILWANILNYSKTGMNSNMVGGLAMILPLLKDIIKPEMVSNQMKIVKYGSAPWVSIKFNDMIKYGIKNVIDGLKKKIKNTKKIDGKELYFQSATCSNIVATKKNKQMPVVNKFYVGGVVKRIPIACTFTAYNDVIKGGFVIDPGYVKKPDLFRECWYQVYQQYCKQCE